MRFRKAKGFTLIEMLVVIAIIGTMVGAVLYFAGQANERKSLNDTTNAIVTMAGKIKSAFNGAGKYDGLTNAVMYSLGVDKPFTATKSGDTVTISDVWQKPVTFEGKNSFFAITLTPKDKKVCFELGSALAGNSIGIVAGSGAAFNTSPANSTNLDDYFGGGWAVKNSSNEFDADALATGCDETNAKLLLVFN